MPKYTNEEIRILELEAGMKDILNSKNIETIKSIAADLVGENAEDYVEDEDFIIDDYEELDFNNE